MRIVRPVFALLLALSMAAAALTYMQGNTWQDRIYVQDWRSSPGHKPYHSYGYPGDTKPDTGRTATGNSDPYVQRYYSQSEGWTYYTLPSYSSGH